MRTERLYIDDEFVDIGTDTRIVLNIKSNLFNDISRIASNSTYTIKLPKTVRNSSVFSLIDVVTSDAGFAYKTHKARYFRDGVEIIKDGTATVLGVTDDGIEIVITWGVFGGLHKLMTDGRSINEFKADDKIIYFNKNSIEKYEDALKRFYFYADYVSYYNSEHSGGEWYSKMWEGDPIKGDFSIIRFFGGAFSGSMANPDRPLVIRREAEVHPVVKVSYILDTITKHYGVDFVFPKYVEEKLNTLVIPLISKNSEFNSDEDVFRCVLEERTGSGALKMTVRWEQFFIINRENDVCEEVISNVDGKLNLGIWADWSLDIKDETKKYNGVEYQHVKKFNSKEEYEEYKFAVTYYLRVTVTTGNDVKEYLIGDKKGKAVVRVPNGFRGRSRLCYEGGGDVEVKKGSKIKVEWLSRWEIGDARFDAGEMIISFLDGGEVVDGTYFPIWKNLPAIKNVDFIRFLCVISGVYPLNSRDGKALRFVDIDAIYMNRDDAYDWTKRLIPYGDDNKPRDIDFSFDGFCKQNIYKWKEDELVQRNYDGVLKIDNDLLDESHVAFEFPFAASDGRVVPIYKKETKEEGRGKPPTVTVTKTSCKDRIMRLCRDEAGFAACYFDMDMQDIIDRDYKVLKKALSKAKIIKEQVRLSDIDVLSFDESRPVYFAQYGRYFAVLGMRIGANEVADVDLLELKF